jgi:hypothetical protein
MKGMPGVRQSQQHIDVEQVSHGKSSIAARTSSLETLISSGDFVIRKPVFKSVTNFGLSSATLSGVSTIEPPCTLHTKVAPGRKCRRLRTFLGKTICPLLDNLDIISYRLTSHCVSQGVRSFAERQR